MKTGGMERCHDSYRSAYKVYKKYQSNYAVAMPSMLKTDLMRLSKSWVCKMN